MVAKGLKRIRLEPETNLVDVLKEVHSDKVPRLIERGGEALVVVISPEDYASTPIAPKSRRMKKSLLRLAGVWRDLDADRMIDDLYKARRVAPPSAPCLYEVPS